MSQRIAMSDEEKSIIVAILRETLPTGVSVHVFGSRASGHVKPWSDLDLVVEGLSPLSLSVIGALAEAFEESALSWKVDVVDRKTVSDEFGRLIDKDKVAFPQIL